MKYEQDQEMRDAVVRLITRIASRENSSVEDAQSVSHMLEALAAFDNVSRAAASGSGLKAVSLTRAEYDALEDKDPGTLYMITG